MHHTEFSCGFSFDGFLDQPSPFRSSGETSFTTPMENHDLSAAQEPSMIIEFQESQAGPGIIDGPNVGHLVTRFTSLDMNATAEEAYSHALTLNYLQESANHTDGVMVKAGSSHDSTPIDLIQLLARFHQTVRPPAASSSASTSILSADRHHARGRQLPSARSNMRGGKGGTRSLTPLSPSRRSTRTLQPRTSIPTLFTEMKSLLTQAEGMLEFIRTDAEEMMKRARCRDRARRESSVEPLPRGQLTEVGGEDGMMVDDSGPRLGGYPAQPRARKVPIARRSTPELSAWYSPSHTLPQVQDHTMSATALVRRRPIITPKRLSKALKLQRLLSQERQDAGLPDLSLAGMGPEDQLSSQPSDPILDICSSRLTELSLSDDVHTFSPRASIDTYPIVSSPGAESIASFPPSTPPSQHAKLAPSSPIINAHSPTLASPMSRSLQFDNPIRFYTGYGQQMHRHSRFLFSPGSKSSGLNWDSKIPDLAL